MEADLHQRLIDGDERALGEVYDLLASYVYGISLRVTRDPNVAEDVTQEVFVTLWEHPERFDPDRGSLRGWLCTVAHHRAVDWIRRNESQKRRADQHARDHAGDMIVSDAFDTVEAKVVHDALAALPPDQSAAIQLAYFDGYTYREVASLLGIPEGTAKSRIRLGLERLGEIMEPEKADAGSR